MQIHPYHQRVVMHIVYFFFSLTEIKTNPFILFYFILQLIYSSRQIVTFKDKD